MPYLEGQGVPNHEAIIYCDSNVPSVGRETAGTCLLICFSKLHQGSERATQKPTRVGYNCFISRIDPEKSGWTSWNDEWRRTWSCPWSGRAENVVDLPGSEWEWMYPFFLSLICRFALLFSPFGIAERETMTLLCLNFEWSLSVDSWCRTSIQPCSSRPCLRPNAACCQYLVQAQLVSPDVGQLLLGGPPP